MSRSTYRAEVLWVLACLAAFSGCGQATAPPSISNSAGSNTTSGSEWEEQIKAVAEGKSVRIEIASDVITDRQFADVAQLPDLRELIVENADISSDSLRHLAAAVLLDHLRLRGARIDDSGVAHLRGLRELRVLNLPQADLTDAGIEAIAALPNLELLRFGSPRVSDAGIQHIAAMKGIRFLHTIGVPVSDRGLQYLQPVQQIESLYFDQSSITDEGLSQLIKFRESQKLPRIHLHIDQQHHDLDPRQHRHCP